MSDYKSKLGATLVTSVAATGFLLGAPSMTEASFGSRNLTFGMEGPDVVVLQEMLKEKGFFQFHTATGYYGTITRQAVQDYQRANNLTPDGMVGPKTLSVLNSEKKPSQSTTTAQNQKTSSSTSSTTTTSTNKNTNNTAGGSTSTSSQAKLAQIKTNQVLRTGSRGDEVIKLQSYLKKAGFFDYHEATGYYGSITEEAVRKFQRARGLQVDGITGPQTIGTINREITNTSTTTSTGSSSSTTGNTSSSNSSTPSSNTNTTNTNTGTNTTNKSTSTTTNTSTTNQNAAGQQSAIANLIKDNVNLRQGHQGVHVTALQTYLKQLGYFNHDVTGYFGTITDTAVRNFQKSAKIKVDGIAGPQTFRAMEQALLSENTHTSNQSSNSSANKSSNTNTNTNTNTGSTGNNDTGQNNTQTQAPTSTLLKEGNSGDSVTELQNRLKVLGHFKQEPTGYFGPVTKQAVIAFQKEWKLISDGLVGQATWDKLEEVSSIHLEDTQTAPTNNDTLNLLNLVADAANYIGSPYLWGGTSGAGFDCSGFVQYIFKKNNIHLPRTVAQQWDATVEVTQLKVGDIVYFETYKAGPSHNGIYIGNNQFIHSGSTNGVTIDRLTANYWSQRYLGARRIK